MDNINLVNRYVLEQVRNGKIEKEMALFILKELTRASQKETDDIAIIGMSGRFPQADNIDDFWDNLKNGRCQIRKFPRDRRQKIGPFYGLSTDSETDPYMEAGFIEEIDKFDAAFFRISPREAMLMEPYQRLFLETVYEAIDDAGYGGDKIYGTDTGIYVGTDHTHKYKANYVSLIKNADLLAMTGSWTGLLASRASYIFNLSGPSVVIDTACSSGLVAIHTACQALKNEECGMAVAGGVNLLLFPLNQGLLEEIVSESSNIRAFDRYAGGTSWGECVTALLLKPLRKAVADRDHIYAVIKGSAINNDGASNGITAPNAAAQEEVIVKAWENAQIDPESISYIETHGTGTLLGDPIEVKGLTNAFERYTKRKQFCGIGSVKTNIGHTVGASGIASLIKVVLAMRHAAIPPSINFDEPNPFINFFNSPVYVNDRLNNWAGTAAPRRAGVSSFGFSGTNCHVVLEEAPLSQPVEAVASGAQIAVFSANSNAGLNKLITRYVKFIDTNVDFDLADLCYTAATGRRHCEFRLFLTVTDQKEFGRKLRELAGQTVETTGVSTITNRQKQELGQAIDARIQQFIAGEKRDLQLLTEIGELYVKGAEADWEKLYQGEPRRKLSLPVYPFERNSYWLTIPKEAELPDRSQTKESPGTTDNKLIRLTGGTGSYSETEITLAQIWGNVLGFEELGLESNFYALGGDSIIAMNIVYAVNKLLKIKLAPSDLFKYPSIAELARYLGDKNVDRQNDNALYQPISRVAEASHYEVSSSQKRLYILSRLGGENTSYNIPVLIMIEGVLDGGRLENAFKEMIRRHEVFRTSFDFIDGRTVQKVAAQVEFEITRYTADEAELASIVKKFVRPFDLQQAPLLRTGLITLAEEKYLLMVDVHHIIADGTSMAIIQKEFISLYEQLELQPVKVQYRDFAKWQNDLLATERMKRQEQYWLDTLRGELPVLEMPVDFARPSIQSYEGDRVIFHTGRALFARLEQFCQENQATQFMVLLAAFNVLLAKYTGQEDIIVGSPISGRTHPDVAEMIGMFVNTLALRNYPVATKNFREFLAEVRDNALRAYENQEYQFEELVDKLVLQRDLSRNALFDVMFVLQTMDNPELEINGLRYRPFNFENKTSKFDLLLQAIPQDGDLKFDLAFSTKLYRRQTIERFSTHLLNTLQMVLANPEKPLWEIDILSETERRSLLVDFNKTASDVCFERTVCEVFEEQVTANPEQLAVSAEDGALTYRELNTRANRVARLLIEHGVRADDVVGLMVERSTDMIVGIMGILKAGGAYLPIEPGYPEERIRYMLDNSRAKVLLNHDRTERKIPFEGLTINLSQQQLSVIDSGNPGRTSGPANLAYVIYTSGTTGNPKGVMIEQRNVINLIMGLNELIYKNYKPNLKVALLAPFIFDASVKQIFAALLGGHTLYIAPEKVRMDGRKLIDFYSEYGIDISDGTPAHLKILAEIPSDGKIVVRHFIIGGEAMVPQDVSRFFNNYALDKPIITNVYGPTECSVDTLAFHVRPEAIDTLPEIPIGAPLQNCSVYILDRYGQPVPLGVIGEIFIGGAGVGRGYINNPELTDAKFVPNPYLPGRKIYRTGDLGKWDCRGQVLFDGRVDHQVKIRGYRIELEEIQKMMLRCDNVKEAVVIARPDSNGQQHLCAYFVAEKVAGDMSTKIREYLAKYIPDYMIPTHVIALDRIPLTFNGKLDRTALPQPDKQNNNDAAYVAPRNQVEADLALVWQEVIGLDKVGINDNFFTIGGDSIKAMQACARLEKYGLYVEVQEVFRHQTIGKISSVVKHQRQKADNRAVIGEFGLVPLQCWLVDHHLETLNHRNLAFMIYRREGFGVQRIQTVFQNLVEHHDALRLVFRQREGRMVQYNQAPEGEFFELRLHDLTGLTDYVQAVEDRVNELQTRMELNNGPLVKLGLFKTGEGEHLAIVIHQLIIDHVSWRIILEDFTTAYLQLVHQEEIKLPDKRASFKEWSDYLYDYANSETLLAEKSYWSGIENSNAVALPTDFAVEDCRVKDNQSVEAELAEKETDILLNNTNVTRGIKIDAVLLAALGLTLKEWTGSDRFVVNLGSHGRYLKAPGMDLSRTVGRFTATYPVLLPPVGSESIIRYVMACNRYLKNIPNKGVGYGILKYLTSEANKTDLCFKLAPDISFNYMGQFDQDVTTEVFTISPLSPGKAISDEEIRSYKINLVMMIKAGRLHIRMDYSGKQYRQTTIRELVANYLTNIQTILDYL